MSNFAAPPPTPPLPRRSITRERVRRLAITLSIALATLPISTGCAAASKEAEAPMAPMAMPAQAPAAMAPPADMAPPPSAAPAAPGYAPPAAYGGDEEEKAPAAAPAAKAAPPVAKAPAAPVRAPSRAPTAPPATATPGRANTEKAEAPKAAEQAPATPARPMLIYVGNLRLQVETDTAIPTTLDKIIDLAEGMGGYLVGRKDTSVEVRIPSQRFRDGFTQIEKLAEVLGRSVSADDVSEQYHDLEVKLSNLKATQKRLQEFLAKAGTMADMLTVGRELERVSAEIDQIEGKMRFLRSRAAFSLITVAVQAKPKPIAIADSSHPPPPPPPPREITLPVTWLPRVGIDALLDLH